MSKIQYVLHNPGQTIVAIGAAGVVYPGLNGTFVVEEDSTDDATINATLKIAQLQLISSSNLSGEFAPSNGGTVVNITGNPGVGNVLTAAFAPGYSGTVQWQRNGANISGATSNTYTQVTADAGTILTVVATSLTFGSSSVTIPALPAAPVNLSLPVITGTAQVGQVLSVSTGSWSNAPSSYAYQWKKGGVNISGATSNTYTPVSGDIGGLITCTVTATNVTGPTSATSTATAAVINGVAPTNSVLPVITGAAQEGQTLSVSTGTWTGTPTGYTYQWKKGGVNISGATANSYTAVNGDIGGVLTCTVTATNAFGSTAATSAGTSAVVAASAAPVNTVLPAISGTAQDGQTLSVSNGTWTGSPTGYTYQWKANGSNISGATNNTYLLVTGNVGQTITCSVTATNGTGSTTATSSATSAVIAAGGGGGNTQPKAGIGAANAYTTPQSLYDSMTALTGSSNGGKSGTFTVAPDVGQYGWYAALASATSSGVIFNDGTGAGGWSGAGLAGNNTGASPSTSTSTVTAVLSDGNTWRFFRQDFSNAGANFTAS